MAKNNNPGKVDLDRVTKSVLNNGGGVREVSYPDGSSHTSVYEKDKNWHISYDEKDGEITNVHTTRDNKPHMDYKGGRKK